MNNPSQESPIFTRTFHFLLWLIPQTEHFPKPFRSTVTQRLLDAALDFQETLLEADALRGRARSDHLWRADGLLNKVRTYLRTAHRLTWLSQGQYEHVSRMVAEIGRLLGGWIKATTG